MHAPEQRRLEAIVEDITRSIAARPDRGKPADYIPELASADLSRFGIAVVTADGKITAASDHDMAFTLQSVSKVFTLTLALGQVGDLIWRRVGREPSGNPFNSILQLEFERGRPRNPFINAGAIAVTDAIVSRHQPRESLGAILRFIRFVADDDAIAINHEVARSEKEAASAT